LCPLLIFPVLHLELPFDIAAAEFPALIKQVAAQWMADAYDHLEFICVDIAMQQFK
jgi:hypothetical protein